ATDLLAEREIWFHEGPLLAAVRASISIPGVFPPVMLRGRLLTDGGLVNPLPMETSLRLDADLTVAVSLFGKPPGRFTASAIEVSADEDEPSQGPLGRLGERLAEVLPSRNRTVDDFFEPLPGDLGLEDMLIKALDVMQARIQSSRVAVNPPDVHIEVPSDLGTLLDFTEANRIIETGREMAIKAFDEAGL
ncbi:MAG: patatin-like phospholipase family protein, partial [Brooklawnia sp.]